MRKSRAGPWGCGCPTKEHAFALRDITVDVATLVRLPHLTFDLPIDVQHAVIAEGEVLWLDYEPDPSASTHCCVVPERYGELEQELIQARFTADPEYSGYELSISYVQLDEDFQWLNADDQLPHGGQQQ